MGEDFSILELLLGGSIALVGSSLTLILEKKWEAKKELAREREASSALAFSTLARVANVVVSNRSLKRSIDECFAETQEANNRDYDPGVKVTPIVGFPEAFEAMSTSEMALVLRTGDSGLLEEMLSLFRNFQTTTKLVSKFNALREDYSRRSVELALDSKESDLDVAMYVVDLKGKLIADSMIGNLNIYVNQMIESSDKDLKQSRELTARLQTAFGELDGLEVPTIKLDME